MGSVRLLKNQQVDLKAIVFCATFLRSPRKRLLKVLSLLPLSLLLKIPLPVGLVKYFCVGSDASEALVNLVTVAARSVKTEVLASRLRMLSCMDENQSLNFLRGIPCCFLQPENDRLVPENCLDDFMSRIPNLKLVRVSGPHFILQCKAEKCWTHIKQFLKSISCV